MLLVQGDHLAPLQVEIVLLVDHPQVQAVMLVQGDYVALLQAQGRLVLGDFLAQLQVQAVTFPQGDLVAPPGSAVGAVNQYL